MHECYCLRLASEGSLKENVVYEKQALLLLLALVGAACAELPESQSASPREERVYRTGSNIAVHERNSTGEALSFDRESWEEMMRNTNRMPVPGAVR